MKTTCPYENLRDIRTDLARIKCRRGVCVCVEEFSHYAALADLVEGVLARKIEEIELANFRENMQCDVY